MKAVGVIILSEDKKHILLSKRSVNEEDEQGKWENVGGKVEITESFEDAVKREVMEELGVTVHSMEQLLTYGQEDSDFCIKVFSVLIYGEPKVMEPFYCDGIEWFAIDKLAEVELASYSREDFKKLGWINN